MLDWLLDDAVRALILEGIFLTILVVARMIPIVQLAPFFGGEATPQPVKMAIAMSLTVIVWPTLWESGHAAMLPENNIALALLVLKEVFIGAILGFVCALVFEAVRISGQVIDLARGQTMATAMVPQLPERVSISADLLYQLAIAVFLVMGGHLIFLRSLVLSFDRLPVYAALDLGADSGAQLAAIFTRLTAEMIALGVLLALPVIAAILLTDLFLALVNKAAPQINVFFLGMPVKAMMGVLIVLLTVELVMARFLGEATMLFAWVDVVIDLLGGR